VFFTAGASWKTAWTAKNFQGGQTITVGAPLENQSRSSYEMALSWQSEKGKKVRAPNHFKSALKTASSPKVAAICHFFGYR
jgi:hypothetical protein